MTEDIILFIAKYGYLAIFVLIFLQEIGAPNPIPNELLLLFSGYLTFIGVLKLPLVILVAVLADFTGTSILHTIFFYSGSYLLQHKPRWLPIPFKAIEKLKKQINGYGQTGIYIGRLTPFIRGYTSVIAGLLLIKSRVFLPIAMITAIIWVTVYVTAGILLGPFWNLVAPTLSNFKYIMLLVISCIIITMIVHSFIRQKTNSED